MAPRDDSHHAPEHAHHASERADRTPPSPKSRSPALKLEEGSTSQLLRQEKTAKVDKGKGRAPMNGVRAAATGRGQAAAGVGAQPLGELKSGAEGSRERPQAGGRTSDVIDLTLSDDDDDGTPSASQKATYPDSDSDIEIIDDPPPRPLHREPVAIAAGASATASGQTPLASTISLKREAPLESLNEARPKVPRLASPAPAHLLRTDEADPSLSLSPASRHSRSPKPSSEVDIPQPRSPTLAYPTPTPVEEDPPPRLLLHHPKGANTLKAREPPRPPPDSTIYRPPGFGSLPSVPGHYDRILRKALDASPDPQAATAANPFASSPGAATPAPHLSPELLRRPTQFGSVQPPPSPTKSTPSLHRRTSSAALLVPTLLAIPTSSAESQTLAKAPLTMALDSQSSSEVDGHQAARFDYWRDKIEGPWPMHLLRPPRSDDTPPPGLENLEEEARCKGYPERRKIVRGVRGSAPSGAGEGEEGRMGEGVEDELGELQMMEGVEGEIAVQPWAVTGLAEMVVHADGREEWRGAPSLPTRKAGSTALAARMEELELEEGALAFGYEREAFLRA